MRMARMAITIIDPRGANDAGLLECPANLFL
jgi:hypothetical protein